MCFFNKPPELKPLPAAPTANDESVKRAKELEAARLAATGGTAATVKTDLAPSSITPQKKVLLGQ
jgi:hypothetical protein